MVPGAPRSVCAKERHLRPAALGNETLLALPRSGRKSVAGQENEPGVPRDPDMQFNCCPLWSQTLEVLPEPPAGEARVYGSGRETSRNGFLLSLLLYFPHQ